MKTKNLFFISIALFAIMINFNCGGNSGKQADNNNAASKTADAGKLIINKWQWVSWKNDMMDQQLASMKKQAESTKDPEMEASLKSTLAGIEEMKKDTMEFRADGSFETSRHVLPADIPQTVYIKGTWSLSPDGKTITASYKMDDRPRTEIYVINSINENDLLLDEQEGMVTSTWKLIK